MATSNGTRSLEYLVTAQDLAAEARHLIRNGEDAKASEKLVEAREIIGYALTALGR